MCCGCCNRPLWTRALRSSLSGPRCWPWTAPVGLTSSRRTGRSTLQLFLPPPRPPPSPSTLPSLRTCWQLLPSQTTLCRCWAPHRQTRTQRHSPAVRRPCRQPPQRQQPWVLASSPTASPTLVCGYWRHHHRRSYGGGRPCASNAPSRPLRPPKRATARPETPRLLAVAARRRHQHHPRRRCRSAFRG
ncbi:hypothetical protein BU14_0056s0028 [Porphyra umbilicalis]|uniref:Uncharacterized protein n=1 Tax=Porphyra umbilicalis TaxID=2786 RepID=A0A1X6PHH1_PORUM|nr:hypothetical protein BU14_0056s0028 [Porphyra umbilicalis]|eukprot:OSX80245.1 hypothetical protein BU14_0056s0028 [Porphyra umbilicalis]